MSAVAPATAAHELPVTVQRSHWYVLVRGAVPDHFPGDPISIWPNVAEPLMVGKVSADGA